jgi:hypothetical protein
MNEISAAADPRWHPETGAAHSVARVLWPSPARVWELGQLPHPATHPGIDFRIDIRPYRRLKETALRAHRTQWRGLSRLCLGNPTVLDWESFGTAMGERPAVVPAARMRACLGEGGPATVFQKRHICFQPEDSLDRALGVYSSYRVGMAREDPMFRLGLAE